MTTKQTSGSGGPGSSGRTNHLADDLRGFMEDDNWEQGITLLEDALALERAAERRATVERLKTALIRGFPVQGSYNRTAVWQTIQRILDEEAAR